MEIANHKCCQQPFGYLFALRTFCLPFFKILTSCHPPCSKSRHHIINCWRVQNTLVLYRFWLSRCFVSLKMVKLYMKLVNYLLYSKCRFDLVLFGSLTKPLPFDIVLVASAGKVILYLSPRSGAFSKVPVNFCHDPSQAKAFLRIWKNVGRLFFLGLVCRCGKNWVRNFGSRFFFNDFWCQMSEGCFGAG